METLIFAFALTTIAILALTDATVAAGGPLRTRLSRQ